MLKNHIRRPLAKKQGKQLNVSLNKVGRNLNFLIKPKISHGRNKQIIKFQVKGFKGQDGFNRGWGKGGKGMLHMNIHLHDPK